MNNKLYVQLVALLVLTVFFVGGALLLNNEYTSGKHEVSKLNRVMNSIDDSDCLASVSSTPQLMDGTINNIDCSGLVKIEFKERIICQVVDGVKCFSNEFIRVEVEVA